MITKRSFVNDWSEKLEKGTGTLFVGAGISTAAKYPTWRELLRAIADELGLDIEQEHDLAAVAQHFVNRNKGKGRLTDVISKQFPRKPVPSVLRVAARLPLRNVWTTNWDELIETAFLENRREAQVMERTGDLTFERADADVVVYKMHGSVRHLDDVVLATDDFELYRIEREAFLRVLAAHLISTSFLFIGISFTDPNLGHLLAGIREMYIRYAPKNLVGKPHYAIVRRPHADDYLGKENADAKFNTAKVRHTLFIEDLLRYNIHAVEIQGYNEIEELLASVEQQISRASVFVAGAVPDGALEPEQAARVRKIGAEVGRVIASSNKRLVSGYGVGVGDSVLSGMLGAGWLSTTSRLERRLTIRPFPQALPPGIDEASFKAQYREDLIAPTGACVVICGMRRKDDGSDFELAAGTRDEIVMARRLERLVVPIGSTHGVAQEVWNEMNSKLDDLDPRIPRDAFAVLGDPMASVVDVGKALAKILSAI